MQFKNTTMSRTYFLIILCCATFSCSESDSVSVDGEVQTNELWVYNLSTGIPIEGGGFNITNQPRNGIRSEIASDTQTGGLSYFYRSIEGFTGVEFITIESCFSPGNDDFTCNDINIELSVIE